MPKTRPLPLAKLILTSLLTVLAVTRLCAQSPIAKPATPETIPVLMLSDIHFDPLHDPVRVARLNAAPLSQWAAILAEPDSPTQAADYAAIQKVCPILPLTDPTDPLWQSTLAALHAQAAHVRFVTLGGDMIGHRFDCRYKQILPTATHADYVAFVKKTFLYVIGGLRAALPGVPIYATMGNNDNVCSDNELAPQNDEFLALAAPIVADALLTDAKTRAQVLRDFPHGYYSAPLPRPMEKTRILVLDDIYSMSSYKTCAAQPDPAAQDPELAWLAVQLKQIRASHQHAWVMGHVPPGINLYSTYNKHADICTGAAPVSFLGSDKLAQVLTANSNVISLALFAHSHTDELRLLRSSGTDPGPGVAIKILPSISPVFAELPSFTLAKVDPRTSTLSDYTVILASNSTGVGTLWNPSYTYSATYHQPAFTPAALNTLIAGFDSDPAASQDASQAYLREYRHYFFNDGSVPLHTLWRPFVCSTDHITPASFTACACPAAK